MRGSRSFVRGGPTLTPFFSFIRRNTTISGPSSARQRHAIYMAFRWRADDGPTFNADLVAFVIFKAKKPYTFLDFTEGSSLWIRACYTRIILIVTTTTDEKKNYRNEAHSRKRTIRIFP